MSEPLPPDVKKEAEREKLGRDFYKFYFLFQQVLDNVGRIMAGKDAPEYESIPDNVKEMDSILRHGISNWIMAPTMPVMSGRMRQFFDTEQGDDELNQAALEVLQNAANIKFTWKQRIERAQTFILKCLHALYPNTPIEQIRELFGGEERERQWLDSISQSPHT